MISCKDVREPVSGSQSNIMKLVHERTIISRFKMGVGACLYMYVVVVKSSRSLSYLLMSSRFTVLLACYHAEMVNKNEYG